MKYIVTGASGLIGSAAVWALNKAGEHDILAVDHLGTSEKWKNLRALRFTDYMERDTFMEYPRRRTGHHPHGRLFLHHGNGCHISGSQQF